MTRPDDKHAPEAPLLPLVAAVIVAAASGPVLDAGFPDRGIWPLAFLGIAMMLVSLIGRSIPASLLIGFVGGMSFYLTHIAWTSLYLGFVPWLALSTLESLFVMVGAATITMAYRWFPRVWRGQTARLVLVPLVVAGLWTAREAISSVWPYGGFAWGRVALSQSESPFAPLVAWLGISGLSFLLVFITALVVQAVREPGIATFTRIVLPAFVIAFVLAIPAWPVQTIGTSRIAAVQGNAKAGYFDEREPGDILKAQLEASIPVLEKGRPVDVMVWPENGSDLDPNRNVPAALALDKLSFYLDAPLLVGTITEREGAIYNTSLLWQNGQVQDYYDKAHPVPFGEYVPDRAFWQPFAPDLLGLIGRDYTPGTRDSVIDIDGMIAGISICFDIVDDALVRDTIDRGAQVLIAQTNNADFGQTDENQQQLAIARMRAIETGRALVNVSTVGTSEIISPTGETLQQIPAFEPGSMVQDVPLTTGTTPSVAVGHQLELFVAFGGLGMLVAAGVLARRPQSTHQRR